MTSETDFTSTSLALARFDAGRGWHREVVDAFAHDTRAFNNPDTVRACVLVGTDPPPAGAELSHLRKTIYRWRALQKEE